ncbi:type II toxin-antitoxin system HicB family antitoxin [Peptoniphilus raoultii]|uniref:type II toxin-antitoxin system HicB family antitoxin n=1 Tax=Peptoniphilus raoultii TaxID=1776387 RepID=UPI0008DB20A7|nr:type II toxin-antitoxin system HicB family antitoxin [Peptoniphilus raoultii]
MNKAYIYPCVVKKEDGVYYANFPDFSACFTDADNMNELFFNVNEVLNGVLFSMLSNEISIPKPYEKGDIVLNDGEFLLLVEASISVLRDKINNKSIKKTVTIPKWLNDISENKNINFSRVLQEGLKKELKIK